MAEIFQNRDQNIKHVELLIAAHRMQFLGIAALLEHTIADEQHRSVWPGLYCTPTMRRSNAPAMHQNRMRCPAMHFPTCW